MKAYYEAVAVKTLALISASIPSSEALLSSAPCVPILGLGGTTVFRGGSSRGVLVLTTKRLIYGDKTYSGEGSRAEWPLSRINAVTLTRKAIVDHLVVNAGGQEYLFVANHSDARPFLLKVTQALSSLSSPSQESSTSGASDLGESLTKVSELFEKGLLSESEFLEAKRRILER
jgi:hypothetical protein